MAQDPLDLNRQNVRFQNTFSGTDIKVIAYLDLSLKKKQQALKALNELENNSRQEAFQQIFGNQAAIDEDTLQGVGQAFANEAKNYSAAADQARDSFKEVVYDLGNLTTLSYSMFREEFAVRPLGMTQAKSYTRGPRTIAGTMVFTVFNHFELDNMVDVLNQGSQNKINLMDQLPPFNVMLIFSNEYGQTSIMHLFDLQFTSEGQSQSVHDSMIDRTFNWYCKDMLPLRPLQRSFSSYSDMFVDELHRVQEERPGFYNTASFESDLRPVTFEDIINQARGDSSNPGNAKIKELIERGRRTTV